MPALGTALKDRQVDVRRAAVQTLSKLGAEAKVALSDLILAFKDQDKLVRTLAIHCVGGLGKDAEPAVPALAQCLADSAVEVRLVAAEELGRLGPIARAALSDLKERQKGDSNGAVREAASEAVKKVEPPC